MFIKCTHKSLPALALSISDAIKREYVEKYQAILLKLFPHTPVDQMQELSDLPRKELLERIKTDGVLHGTDLAAAARETGASPVPVHNDSTRKIFHLLPEEGIDTRCRGDAVSSNYTNIGDITFHPLEHAHCLDVSTTSASYSAPQDPRLIETYAAPFPAYATDKRMLSRNEQAIERIINICDHFLAKDDSGQGLV